MSRERLHLFFHEAPDGMGVDVPTGGHVISAYALGVVVGAPLFAVAVGGGHLGIDDVSFRYGQVPLKAALARGDAIAWRLSREDGVWRLLATIDETPPPSSRTAAQG